MRALRTIGMVALAASVGCSSPTEPHSTLLVTTSISATGLHTGDSVLVKVSVVNLGTKPDTINDGHGSHYAVRSELWVSAGRTNAVDFEIVL